MTVAGMPDTVAHGSGGASRTVQFIMKNLKTPNLFFGITRRPRSYISDLDYFVR
jgi:hypothetical protein